VQVPERLYNVADYHSASYRDKNTMRASHVNPLDRPGLFDPALFGLTEEEAARLDPQQRLALTVAYEALDMAGVPKDPDSGVFIASCSDDYRENVSAPIRPGFVDGTFRPYIANRLSSYLGWRGPSITLDTACSSALVAIESACSYLLADKCNVALAGGVNVITQPQITIGLDRGFFLSSTGQCKTFDDGADGYCRADAISLVVLKRLSDAVRDRDPILGVIVSAGTNHSGASYSITHPHAPTQQRLYRSGLDSAKLTPAQLGYVECHGTGTQAGDAEEMTGLLDVFSTGPGRDGVAPLIVGSVKANLGHSESVRRLYLFTSQNVSILSNALLSSCRRQGRRLSSRPCWFSRRSVFPDTPESRPKSITLSRTWSLRASAFLSSLPNSLGRPMNTDTLWSTTLALRSVPLLLYPKLARYLCIFLLSGWKL
jgi:acyl transferase domain-containing protein